MKDYNSPVNRVAKNTLVLPEFSEVLYIHEPIMKLMRSPDAGFALCAIIGLGQDFRIDLTSEASEKATIKKISDKTMRVLHPSRVATCIDMIVDAGLITRIEPYIFAVDLAELQRRIGLLGKKKELRLQIEEIKKQIASLGESHE